MSVRTRRQEPGVLESATGPRARAAWRDPRRTGARAGPARPGARTVCASRRAGRPPGAGSTCPARVVRTRHGLFRCACVASCRDVSRVPIGDAGRRTTKAGGRLLAVTRKPIALGAPGARDCRFPYGRAGAGRSAGGPLPARAQGAAGGITHRGRRRVAGTQPGRHPPGPWTAEQHAPSAAAASVKSKSPRSRRVSPRAFTEPPSGFEPETYALRVRCSGHLS